MGRTTGITVSQQVVAIPRQFFADTHARPCLHFGREIQLLFLAHASHLGHLRFQFVIPLPKFGYFPQRVFDPPIGILNFMCLLLLRSPQRVEFISMMLLSLCGSLR